MSDQIARDDIVKKVVEIIAEQAMLRPDEVSLTSSPEELGLDSLAVVEIVFAIEETFNVSVPFNANEPNGSDFDISSVERVVAGVESLLSAKG